MLKPWVCFPSAKEEKAQACARKWRAQGYQVACYYDEGKVGSAGDINYQGQFPGYYGIIGWLSGKCFEYGADVVTCIGDDMDPDPNLTGPKIAEMYLNRFPDGFGILQACGDPQGVDATGKPAAARICGSPTFGIGWQKRAYGGSGPFWAAYHSFYGDEDLWHVASILGVLWLNPNLTFMHRHWSWGHHHPEEYQKRNSEQHWLLDQQLFFQRKASGFPSHEPLEIKSNAEV